MPTLPCALLMTLMLAGAARAETRPLVWYGPRAPAGHSAGIADWAAIFAPDAPWGDAARHVDVFDLNAEHMAEWPEDKIAAEVASLRARGIKISMTVMPLPRADGECGGKIEGYAPAGGAERTAERLKRAGVAPDYMILDGPMTFGRYADGETACRSSVERVAEQASHTVRVFCDAFPDLVVGAVEGVPVIGAHPAWPSDYAAFLAGMAARGRKLSFLMTDVAWRNPAVETELPLVAAFARANGLAFGVIYNGDDRDRSDLAWTAHARRNMALAEGRLGLAPDQAVFVSWNDHPSRSMPDSDPGTLSSLVLEHAKARPVLDARREGAAVSGRLADATGAPVPGAAVTLSRLGVDRTRPLPVQSVRGRVPDGARFALLGWRVNCECLCAGENDLLAGALTYADSGGGAGRYSLADDPHVRGPRADGARIGPDLAGGEAVARLRAGPGQSFMTTTGAFPVSGGADYALSVPLGSLDGRGMFGQATVIFLDADQRGITRGDIPLGEQAAEVATARTDAAGRFRLAVPKGAEAACLRAGFAGSAALRAAERELPCEG